MAHLIFRRLSGAAFDALRAAAAAKYLSGRTSEEGEVSILRFARWGADLLAIFVAVLAGLHYFGVSPNATMAGVGVGGIAVAIAAQKTLENVIGGAALTGPCVWVIS